MNVPLRSLPLLATVALLLATAARQVDPVVVAVADEAASPVTGEQFSVVDEEPTAALTETPVPTETPLPTPTETSLPTESPSPTETQMPVPIATATPAPDEQVTFNADQTSLTLVLTAKDDGAGEHRVDFGNIAPTGQAPTAAGVTVSPFAGGATYLASRAVTVTVTSTGSGWTGACYASGGVHLDLAWALHGSGNAPVPFAADPSGGQGCIPPASAGTTDATYSYDYQLTVTWTDQPGIYSSAITYSVTAE